MQRRVVVSGMGVVSSVGIGVNHLGIYKSGKCGISKIERIDVSDMPTKIGAEIKTLTLTTLLIRKKPKEWIDSLNMPL